MSNLINLDEKQLTMSSREIAELTNKRHDNVCRDIRAILVALLGGEDVDYVRNSNLSYLTNQHVSCEQYDNKNPNAWEYHISRRYTEILITGYDIKRRTAVIDRLYQLESEKQNMRPSLPTAKELTLMVVQAEEEKEKLQLEVKELKPKAEFHDMAIETHGSLSVSQAAKSLGTGRHRLLDFLRKIGWVRRDNEPYQEKITQGLLNVKLSNWEHSENGIQRTVTTLITGKGLVKLAELITHQNEA